MKLVQKQREPLARAVIRATIERFLEQQLLNVARETSPSALHRFPEHCREVMSVDWHSEPTREFEPPFR